MGVLSDKYIVPPLSVFDTRQKYWTQRLKYWDKIGLYSDNGRYNVLTNSSNVKPQSSTGFSTIAPTTSKFSPVLCEVIYKWFCPHNAKILDPFAGGVTRGGVASIMGFDYHGFDISQNQITSNVRLCESMGLTANYYLDTSKNAEKYFEKEFDLLFSCPPYYNLEKYTDNPDDLSNLATYNDFLKEYTEIIKICAALLKNNRFAVFVVGDIRSKQGDYCNFISDTINAFAQCGLKLYNNIILLEQVGTRAMTCERPFLTNRKVSKVHQNVLVMYKGDIEEIKKTFKGTF